MKLLFDEDFSDIQMLKGFPPKTKYIKNDKLNLSFNDGSIDICPKNHKNTSKSPC